MIAGWFSGLRKLFQLSMIEILNNPGGKVDTCGVPLVRRPQVDSAPVISTPWVWLPPASPSPADERVTGTGSGD